MRLEVVCVGAVTVDTIAVVEHLPAEDTRVVAEPFVVAGGGPAATAAVALARLGVPVGFCGVVGDDEDGRLSRRLLEAEGVDTRWLLTRPGVPTARSVILVSRGTGSRTIVTTSAPPPDPASVPVGAAGWLHVDQTGYGSVRAALRGAEGPAALSVDGGNPLPRLELRGVDLYVPTAGSLRAAFPAPDLATSMCAAAAAGARRVVATGGGDGCHVLAGDGAVVHLAPHPVRAVSTIGAGDVFHGALLAGLVAGRPLLAAAREANVAAALSCLALDGRSGIPDRARLAAHLPAHPDPGDDEYR